MSQKEYLSVEGNDLPGDWGSVGITRRSTQEGQEQRRAGIYLFQFVMPGRNGEDSYKLLYLAHQ